jgi:hypothetical protein
MVEVLCILYHLPISQSADNLFVNKIHAYEPELSLVETLNPRKYNAD